MKYTKANDVIKFAMIERWQQSGQSKTEFCKTENIAFHVFYYWHNKYKLQNTHATNFIKIAVPKTNQKSLNYCELQFTNGMRLVFNETPSANFIKQLL